MTTLFVDGVNQGDGVCIRMNNNGSTANTYIQPVTSKDIACGKYSTGPDIILYFNPTTVRAGEQC